MRPKPGDQMFLRTQEAAEHARHARQIPAPGRAPGRAASHGSRTIMSSARAGVDASRHVVRSGGSRGERTIVKPTVVTTRRSAALVGSQTPSRPPSCALGTEPLAAAVGRLVVAAVGSPRLVDVLPPAGTLEGPDARSQTSRSVCLWGHPSASLRQREHTTL